MNIENTLMNLGYIDYLNCFPFYYHMFEKQAVENIVIHSGYPSKLNHDIRECSLDMSPISAATGADISDDVLILPDFCLSSVGYVGSVILVSKVPVGDLHRKRIGITSASHTSVVLLKTLLTKYYDVKPEYVQTGPMPNLPGLDAMLLIGNEAMIYRPEPELKVYDLGELWMEKTGFPVVFAIFVLRKEIVSQYTREIRNVIQSFHNSLKCLETDRKNLVLKAQNKYPDIKYNIEDYYRLLEFKFTGDLKKALEFYYSEAGSLGLIKTVKKLEYYSV